jgi:hypothetical protein
MRVTVTVGLYNTKILQYLLEDNIEMDSKKVDRGCEMLKFWLSIGFSNGA